ncbi:hypothetical protein HW555_010598, partial [Spodoptera exigua]
ATHVKLIPFWDLSENQISDILNQSDFEDVSDDETYFVNSDLENHHSSSSDEGSNSDTEVVTTGVRSRGVRTRGGVRIRGIRGRRGVRTRGGSTSCLREIIQEGEWNREPSYLPSDVNSDNIFDYFEQYVDDDIIEHIVTKSNQTAIERTGRSLNFTKEECKIYFGITMMMACIPFSQIRLYWNRQYALPIISQAMTRDRYFLLRNSIKVVFDNDITAEMKRDDKLWKVRPIFDRVLQGCRKQLKEHKMSIDEMIIPFTGACPIRQFCPGKPNPTGIKAFVLANPNGLVCDIIIYQGKDTVIAENGSQFHLGEKIVLKLTESLVPGHILYFDRYFTTVRLANELDTRGFKCVGTLMKNRVPVELIDDNVYKNVSFDDDGIPETETNVVVRRPPIVPLPSKAKRKHGIDHLPDMSSVQHRCRNQGCTKKTSVKCIGCNLSLCLTAKRNCFKIFHERD